VPRLSCARCSAATGTAQTYTERTGEWGSRSVGRPMKRSTLRSLYFAAALLAAVACATGGAPAWERRVGDADVEAYRALVERLADDAMEGRGVTTQGNARATALLVEAFRAAGVAAGGAAARGRRAGPARPPGDLRALFPPVAAAG
jgi:hypothetical protein